jgi:UDP-N-acetylmuramyl tripeptide synthase
MQHTKSDRRADLDWRNDLRKQKSSQVPSRESRAKRQEGTDSSASVARMAPRSQTHSKQKRYSLRAGLAVMGGRAAGALSRRLHLGGGTSIVGVVAQRLYPDIVEHLAAQLEYGSVIVTGTNGKTTTSSFLAAIVSDAGLRVWRNREGSNMLRGVASSLVIRALPNGKLRRSGRAISILEIDEAVLPQIVQLISPRVVIFTNLFRDQLDRYGEVDSVLARWRQAIASLPASTTLVLNADDPATASLGTSFSSTVLYYGIDDLSGDVTAQPQEQGHHQVMDTRTCPVCGTAYEYKMHFFSHMGHYYCPNCGQHRPQPDVYATQVQTVSFDRQRIQVTTPTRQGDIIIPLPGFYNVYNALAAITAAQALSIGWDPIVTGIEQFKPAFGRGERIQAEGRTIRLLLAKNPTGFNEVLRTLFQENIPRHVLFVLNDNTADGRDISWIWDVDFERASGLLQTVVVAGTRALDLALRLKYAGTSPETMTIVPPAPLRAQRQARKPFRRRDRTARSTATETTADLAALSNTHFTHGFGLRQALTTALQQTPIGETLFIVPTYTGLLEVHHELEQRGLAPRYWEGRDA